jgi:hypothetical protein
MADRNERHFLEFYTPVRQRIGRLAGRRHAKTERQQKQHTTPFSDDKENPTSDRSDFGAVPATIPGEKAVDIGRQRRRLFTRSVSKQRGVDNDRGGNDDGDGTKSNAVHTSRDLTNIHYTTAAADLAFTSPPGSGSIVSRALFSTNANATPVADTVDDNTNSPNFYSPPGSSNLLKEYRSKKSLLSSSKTRTSLFSSPIPGERRLSSSTLWKRGRGDQKTEEDQKKNPNDSPSIAAIETPKTKTVQVSPAVINSTPPTSSSTEDFPTENSINSIVERTPSSTTLPPMTPNTTPKSQSFWSPPGTSRLLRKYRQRKSPPSGETTSHSNYGRSRTTPRGHRGLRLLDSGAKRCRNHHLSLRPRPAANEATTPAKAKIRARINTDAKVKDSPVITTTNDNKSLLSPSTAKRLNKDIQSYRKAHGRAKSTNALVVTKKKSPLLDETERATVAQEYHNGSNWEGTENCTGRNVEGGLEIALYTQFMPALSASGNAEGHTLDPTNDEDITDSLPFDEQNAANTFVNIDMPRSTHESSVQDEIVEDISSPEAVAANPSDEDATKSGVFQSTRSASRARRQSMRDAAKITCSPDTAKIISSPDATAANTNKGEESESDVFRSTRPATRSRRISLHDVAEAATTANPKDGEDEGSGIFRSTRSDSRAHRNSIHDAVEAITPATGPVTNSKGDQDEGSSVFRSTISATRARRESSAEAVIEIIDNDTGIFRSTRSATRARRKSLIEAVKAVSAAEAAITGKSGVNTTGNSLLVEDTTCGDSNVDSSTLASYLPPQDGNDTPSSKGSLQSIWDALHCGGEEGRNIVTAFPENMCDSNIHTDIVSRVGDCVNPMATTLMKMWREEEEAVANHQKQLQASQYADIKDQTDPNVAAPISATLVEDKKGGTVSPQSPPPKSFSSDLNLVYGLERVQNLTLARPKALQASPTTNVESPSMDSPGPNPKPLASCSQ